MPKYAIISKEPPEKPLGYSLTVVQSEEQPLINPQPFKTMDEATVCAIECGINKLQILVMSPSDLSIAEVRIAELLEELQFSYDRMAHLLYIFENPDSFRASFGPGETMTTLKTYLPEVQKKYNLDPYPTEDKSNTENQQP